MTAYSASASFGGGTQIGTGNYVVYQSTGTSVTVTNLNPAQTYHVAIYEYNGSSGRVYLLPGATASQATGGAPTVSASNISFNFIDGNYFRMFWASGNGNRRIVVARAGSAVTGTPTDGLDYTPSSTFGSGDAISPGEFVMYDNSGTFADLFGFSAATTYHFAIFEYNGSGANTVYQQVGVGTASQATLSAPTTGVSGLTFSNVSGNSMQISWTNGNGSARLVLMREGSAVNGIPADLTNYSPSASFGAGSQIGAGNYAVYSSVGSQVTVTNLNPGSIYHIEVFEYSGSGGRVYRVPGAIGSQATGGAPLISATNLGFQFVTASSMRLSWTNGGGARRVIVARASSPVTSVLTDGQPYSGSSVFGSGDQVNAGEFVVYDGVSTFLDISGLSVNTVYHFAIFEYNGSGANTLYQQAGYLTGSQSTAQPPAVGVSNLTFPVVNTNSITLGWTNGSGVGRMIVATEAGAVLSASPNNGTTYSVSSAYGSGSAIGNGFVVYRGSGSTFTVTGLQSGTNYTFYIFEYNGSSSSPAFLIPGVSGSQLTSGAPAIQPSNPVFSAIQTTAITIDWTNGGGQNRMVVIRPGAAVAGVPVDGTSYSASSFYGSGDQLSPGEFIIYAGNGSSVTVTNLQPGTGYQIAIFEYNGVTTTTLFNAISPAIGSFSTNSLPFAVEWLGLDARWTGNSAIIEWITASEMNSERFEVERKRETGDWKPIGTASAAGSSSAPISYQLEDLQARDKDLYRVVEIDFDGNRSISNQVELNLDHPFLLQAFPNPVSDVLTIQSPESLGLIELLDLTGKIVKREWTDATSATIVVSDLPSGIYWIKTTGGKSAKQIRIMR